jgi:8-oxo-dGTP pyrophosphatase MutT (NUDIX family)
MRIRAGVIVIKDNKVALIERQRAGLHYFTFPGGGVNADETPELAAIRETEEELGLQITIQYKVAVVHLGKGIQHYYLVQKLGGEFGTGKGEEYQHSLPDRSDRGTYHPMWMPIAELPEHDNVYPADVAVLVVKSIKDGWPKEPVIIFEEPK